MHRFTGVICIGYDPGEPPKGGFQQKTITCENLSSKTNMKLINGTPDRKLIGKINPAEIRETAAEYEKRRMGLSSAMVRRIEEIVKGLKAEQRRVITAA